MATQASTEPIRQLWFRTEDALTGVALIAVAAALLAFYTSSTAMRIGCVAMQLFVYACMVIRSDNRHLRNMSFLVLAASLPFAAINSFTSEFRSLIVPFCFLGGIGCAWFALELRKTFYVFELPFYCFLALTVFLIVARGYGPGQFNYFFSGIGRNGYSAILFSLTCGYLVSRTSRNLSPSIILLATAFACSFPLYGRSSIVAMGILFSASAMVRWPRAAGIVGAVSVVVLVFGYVGLGFISQITNFKGGIDSDRWAILGEYVSLLNPRTIVLGVPFIDVQTIQWNNGSPDLAFVRLHSYLGLSIILFVFLFCESAMTLIRGRLWLLAAVFFAVIFRASTDVILLFGTVDLFFIPVIFFAYFARYLRIPAKKSVFLSSGAE